MSMEQKPDNLNNEGLKKNLRIALEEYLSAVDKISNRKYIKDAELAYDVANRSREEITERKKKIISILAEELKIASNKREVLNTMCEVFEDLNNSRSTLYETDDLTGEYALLSFLQDVILEVLN